jgi:hypothetical protein
MGDSSRTLANREGAVIDRYYRLGGRVVKLDYRTLSVERR